MTPSRLRMLGLTTACLAVLGGCSAFRNARLDEDAFRVKSGRERTVDPADGSLLDAFRGAKDTVKVNRFLWTATLDVLNSIQRKWVYLEPIFGRGAMPHEQARFRRVDDEFRALMSSIVDDPRVFSVLKVPQLVT